MDPIFPNVFTDERKPEDVNLINEITNLLKNAGVENPSNWINNQIIFEASNAGPKLERFLVNRYWRLRLAEVNSNESIALACLKELHDLDTGDYLKIFNKYVVPRIVFLNLF